MLPQIPRPADFDVSPEHGFLPAELPLQFLDDPYYRPWESTVQALQALILTRRLRGVVDSLPVLSTDYLRSEPEWRRAYSILAFVAHAYIWGGDTPVDRVPPSISAPFLSTCQHLELPPVATYAGLVLWNWRPLDPSQPIDSLENIFTLNTATGSLDESWFYLVSVAIEARAAPTIPLMLTAIEAARYGDSHTVTECLRSFAERLDELGTLLQRMYENCDPHVFYHRIRPYLAGSKNMADAGLPNGVVFDDGTSEPQHYVQFSGGSNAQSSIIQFFDIVLGIEHRPTGSKPQEPSSSSAQGQPSAPPAPSHNFIQEMRTYMPGPHKRFLEAVTGVANVRQYVEARRSDRALCTAFDACLAMLRAFRDKHIQMVSRYIIVKSRESRSQSRSLSPAHGGSQRVNLASANRRQQASVGSVGMEGAGRKKDLRGTGGTALIPFLKQARDETGEPAIDAWARRLLNNGPADAGGRGGARLTKMGEHASGEMEIVGLAGVWSVDDSEGGICHW
ncbi:putative indoleamine -dioxygenase subfamily protein [Neofusicoccum parvum UCRNP2]|uniref:Indoleamine 2,3-dioxygenase n=1 Tax=Botryosphaeria parva (strain UCR-NP2) TaxID=1287680 RepID=R1EMB2_BOTPV|nr:putative indoleamine -dioxygenase subfamily protein [Neofusicoccum parvum UCRNP2]